MSPMMPERDEDLPYAPPPCTICSSPLGKHFTVEANHYDAERASDGFHGWYRVCPTTMVLLKQLMLTGHHYRDGLEVPQ